MPQQQFTVEVKGLDVLRQKLDARNLLRPTREIVAAAGREGLETSRKAARPHPADKGTLARLINSDTRDGGKTVVIEPQTQVRGIAGTIEEGRRPGSRPPYGSIKRWMLSHGIITGVRGESRLVKMMQQRIRATGTEGVGFMRQGEEAAERSLKGGVRGTEAEIEREWDRGY